MTLTMFKQQLYDAAYLTLQVIKALAFLAAWIATGILPWVAHELSGVVAKLAGF